MWDLTVHYARVYHALSSSNKNVLERVMGYHMACVVDTNLAYLDGVIPLFLYPIEVAEVLNVTTTQRLSHTRS